MAGLTASRQTPELNAPEDVLFGVEASTSVFIGSMVALDVNGYAVPAQALGSSPLSALTVVGVAMRTYLGFPGQDAINQSSALIPGTQQSAGAAGAVSVKVRRGVFKIDNDGSITIANIGAVAYAKDDHTVQAGNGSGTLVAAGRIVAVDSDGVWVDFMHGKLPAKQIETADIDAGAVTLPKVGFPAAGMKTLTVVGAASAGACTATGAAVGDRLVSIFGAPTAGGALLAKVPGTDFEATVSVANQLQQLSSSNLSSDTFIAVFAPAAA